MYDPDNALLRPCPASQGDNYGTFIGMGLTDIAETKPAKTLMGVQLTKDPEQYCYNFYEKYRVYIEYNTRVCYGGLEVERNVLIV